MQKLMRRTVSALGAALGLAVAALPVAGVWSGEARAFEMGSTAREAILIDLTTGTVLMEQNADELMPPASMSKLMTIYLLFKYLAEGRLNINDQLPVSQFAMDRNGSDMFLEAGQRVRVDDLMRGIIVQSGNDASIVVAEGLAGSETAFAELMTREARALGMEHSTFANSTGWPDPNHRMTARDLAILATHLIQDYPEHYAIFSEREFTYNDITQPNRNPLLSRNIGADGLKTGHTEEAGYGLVASAVRGNRRLLLVVHGLGTEQQRADEAARLIDWGFSEFELLDMYADGDVVTSAEVWMGEEEQVPLVVHEDARVSIYRREIDEMRVTVKLDGPIPAPVAAGDPVARLEITAPGMEPRVYTLYAGESVPEAGFLGRIWATLNYLVFG